MVGWDAGSRRLIFSRRVARRDGNVVTNTIILAVATAAAATIKKMRTLPSSGNTAAASLKMI